MTMYARLLGGGSSILWKEEHSRRGELSLKRPKESIPSANRAIVRMAHKWLLYVFSSYCLSMVCSEVKHQGEGGEVKMVR